MEKRIKLNSVATYNGHSVQANGIVVLNIKADYSELANTVQALQLLNNDITIAVKYAQQNPMKLGVFRLDNISIGSDGASKVRFKGSVDYVETDNLNTMAINGLGELFSMKMIADVEIESDEVGE